MNLTPEMEHQIVDEVSPSPRLNELHSDEPHYVRRRYWRFRPKQDITAYELARVIEKIRVAFDSRHRLPPDIRRHFQEE